MPRFCSSLTALTGLAGLLVLSGCVDRTVTITSVPAGALVWLNDREVGRTPVTVGFLHYGVYDVRLELEGYEPTMTTGRADAPLWDAPGPDLLAELFPASLESEVHWHFELQPGNRDRDALILEAQALRKQATDTASVR
jgi:hypothetical protein